MASALIGHVTRVNHNTIVHQYRPYTQWDCCIYQRTIHIQLYKPVCGAPKKRGAYRMNAYATADRYSFSELKAGGGVQTVSRGICGFSETHGVGFGVSTGVSSAGFNWGFKRWFQLGFQAHPTPRRASPPTAR